MFAGETQADVLMETYMAIPAGVLIATGLVKAMLTLPSSTWAGAVDTSFPSSSRA